MTLTIKDHDLDLFLSTALKENLTGHYQIHEFSRAAFFPCLILDSGKKNLFQFCESDEMIPFAT